MVSTKVPRFAGVTSWEQYRQVFDAIVRSNGWDDATAALQLLSHLEGRCAERGSSGAGNEARNASRTNWGIDCTLRVTGTAGRVVAASSVRRPRSPGRNLPFLQ